jgi:hypothetical protein
LPVKILPWLAPKTLRVASEVDLRATRRATVLYRLGGYSTTSDTISCRLPVLIDK